MASAPSLGRRSPRPGRNRLSRRNAVAEPRARSDPGPVFFAEDPHAGSGVKAVMRSARNAKLTAASSSKISDGAAATVQCPPTKRAKAASSWSRASSPMPPIRRRRNRVHHRDGTNEGPRHPARKGQSQRRRSRHWHPSGANGAHLLVTLLLPTIFCMASGMQRRSVRLSTPLPTERQRSPSTIQVGGCPWLVHPLAGGSR